MSKMIIENDERPDARWDRTTRMLSRIEWQMDIRPLPGYGLTAFYKGRHVIGRDRRIVEGVYLGTFAREAIVVSERCGTLAKKYNELVIRLGLFPWTLDEFSIIQSVHTYVRALLPGGEEKTRAIIRASLPAGNVDQKIDLTVFVHGGAGVCRHRALLAGYFLEKLISDRLLIGTCSVDRNETDEGGHAWARFVSDQTGLILVIDAGLDECGDIFKVDQRWNYRRPEDTRPIPAVDRNPKPEPKKPKPLIDNIDRAVAAAGSLWAVWHFGLSRLF